MKKFLLVVGIFVLAITSLVACGGKKSGLADKKIVVGTNAEYEPFEYLDDNGELAGFDIDIMNALAEKMDVEVEWVDMAFDSLIGSMEAGNTEMLIAAIGPSEDRARSAEFSDVYYTGCQSILVSEGSSIKTFDDLNGKTIAVLEGSLSDLIASGDTTDYGVIENATVKRFKKSTDAVMELENAAADAVLTDKIIAEKFVEDHEGLTQYPIDSTAEDTVMCIKKGDQELLDAVNKALKEIKDEGLYDQIYTKYFAE